MASFKDQLDGLVSSMYIEGLLDDQFRQLQMLQDPTDPGFVAEVITLFCKDCERMLNDLTTLMDQPDVDYQKADSYVHQMKGSSSSIGARRIKQACILFRGFCQDKKRDGCIEALNVMKHEYVHLRGKFEIMLQLEQKIQNCGS